MDGRSRVADRQVPVNLYRNVFYEVADDPFYADWHKLDHMKPDWGMWVHTFAQLLPPDRYFAEHPEYYALVDGKRVGMQADGHLCAQLCLTDPDVLETVVENLGDRMREQPTPFIGRSVRTTPMPSTAITAPVPPAGSWTSRPALRAVRSSLSPTAWPLGSRTK